MEIIAALAVEKVNHPDLALQCALLHDVIEDTDINYQTIKKTFGIKVANGVDALSKRDEVKKAQRLSDSLNRIQDQPHEVWMVKLADRISNLQPPPHHWTQTKITTYWESSKIIYAALKESSPYLRERLLQKIDNYSNYIK